MLLSKLDRDKRTITLHHGGRKAAGSIGLRDNCFKLQAIFSQGQTENRM